MPIVEIAGDKPTPAEWRLIEEHLKDAFPPEMVSFRVLNNPDESKANPSAKIAAFISADDVENWLDRIVGPENWEFHLVPTASLNGAMTSAIGELTIFGITKSDAGDAAAGESEPSKRTASDALKRAAKKWGVFRYAYGLKGMWARVQKEGRGWVLASGEEERLRRELPKPRYSKSPADTQVAQPATQAQESADPPTHRLPRRIPTPASTNPPPSTGNTANGAKAEQISSIYALGKRRGMDTATVDQYCTKHYGVPTSELTLQQAGEVITNLQKRTA